MNKIASNPLVSVVIVTTNNKKWLIRSLPSVVNQSYHPLEIVVVENASTDNTYELIRKRFPTIKIIRKKLNDGFGKSCDLGIKNTQGFYIFIGNDDLFLEKNYLEKLVKQMEHDKQIAAMQGTMYSYLKKDSIESTGLFFNETGYLRGDFIRSNTKQKGLVPIFSAHAPLIRRDVYEKIGGFDTDYFLYFEEVDLCWRMQLFGYKIMYYPKAKMFHVGAATTSRLPYESMFEHSYRNRITTFLKNAAVLTLIRTMIIQFMLHLVTIILLVLKGKISLGLAVIRAWGWNILHISKIYKKRQDIQKSRIISDRLLFSKVGTTLSVHDLLRSNKI